MTSPSGLNSPFFSFAATPSYTHVLGPHTALRAGIDAEIVPYIETTASWHAETDVRLTITRGLHSIAAALSGGYWAEQEESSLESLPSYGYVKGTAEYRIDWRHPASVTYSLDGLCGRGSTSWRSRHSLWVKMHFTGLDWLLPSARLGLSGGGADKYLQVMLSPSAAVSLGKRNTVTLLVYQAWRFYDQSVADTLYAQGNKIVGYADNQRVTAVYLSYGRDLLKKLELFVDYDVTYRGGSAVPVDFLSHGLALGLTLRLGES